MYIQSLHWEMKIKWKKYKQRRTEIIKQFEYGKYEILLRPVFCYGVKTLIFSFMFKQEIKNIQIYYKMNFDKAFEVDEIKLKDQKVGQ